MARNFYATPVFTVAGMVGAIMFVIGTAVFGMMLFVAAAPSLLQAVIIVGAAMTALIGVPMMIVGRGAIYSEAPPSWAPDERRDQPTAE